MAAFDVETFLKVKQFTGTSNIEAIGMSFGLPSCILDLGAKALSLLPLDMLFILRRDIDSAERRAEDKVYQAFKWIGEQTGLFQYDSETGTFSSDRDWETACPMVEGIML